MHSLSTQDALEYFIPAVHCPSLMTTDVERTGKGTQAGGELQTILSMRMQSKGVEVLSLATACYPCLISWNQVESSKSRKSPVLDLRVSLKGSLILPLTGHQSRDSNR